MGSEDIIEDVNSGGNDLTNNNVIFSEDRVVHYDKEAIAKIRSALFTPLDQNATTKQKEEAFSYLTNDINTIPLMNLGELYLKTQNHPK